MKKRMNELIKIQKELDLLHKMRIDAILAFKIPIRYLKRPKRAKGGLKSAVSK